VAISEDTLAALNQVVLTLPFHQFCGVSLVKQEAGRAVIQIPINGNTANPNGVLHGGILYAVMDVAAYLALAPLFNAGENAVSHDVHVSVMRPIAKGDTLELRSEVRRRGKGIAFMTVEAYAVSSGQIVGTGTITKTFVSVSR
jgi:uncharacterized protein (TIGR00369 family)